MSLNSERIHRVFVCTIYWQTNVRSMQNECTISNKRVKVAMAKNLHSYKCICNTILLHILPYMYCIMYNCTYSCRYYKVCKMKFHSINKKLHEVWTIPPFEYQRQKYSNILWTMEWMSTITRNSFGKNQSNQIEWCNGTKFNNEKTNKCVLNSVGPWVC